ncbi:MAG: BMP family ABC transporter substrate-binding protein [Acidimicrobiales bacterium]
MPKLRHVAAALGFALLVAGCASSSDTANTPDKGDAAAAAGAVDVGLKPGEKLKAAFVYIGPIGDAGWTHQHDKGAKHLGSTMAGQVEVSVVENVPEDASASRVFEDLYRKGNRLIFGTSFGYADPMLEVAAAHPDLVLMHATGYKTAKNMGTYFGAAEEARYLSGIAAGKASASGKIGYVAAFPIPEVIRGINAFALGAQSVNPQATVTVEWTSTWFDPDKERTAAEKLLDGGADVLSQHQDTPAAGEAAERRGAKWIGYNDDMARFAPKAWLTAPVWNWGPFYAETAKSVIDRSWRSEQHYGSMADGMVDLAPLSPLVDPAAKAAIEQAKERLVAGSLKPFTGPIKDQAGVVRIAQGAPAPLEDLLKMDWFVYGVQGSPKTS